MAKKYAINKEFGPFAHLHAPIGRPLLAALRAFPAFRPLSRRGITVRPLSIPGESLVKAFLIEPAGCSETLPCLVYFHGGGFVMRAAPSHCEIMRRYAVLSHIKVLYVDYRLAPKHPYPAVLDDCLAAYRFALDNAEKIGIDRAKIAVGGDSAGGCLAAALCHTARGRGIALPRFQLLIYPVTDCRMRTASMKKYTDTPMWNAVLNKKMWGWYLPNGMQPDAGASPALAQSFDLLPPAYIETAEFDCLHDEGAEYASLLQKIGRAHV